MAALMELSNPVHSNATFTIPPAASLINSATPSGAVPFGICTVLMFGKSVLANSNREATRSVRTMGVHPAADAARAVTRPIGPAPLVDVSCNILDPARYLDCQHKVGIGDVPDHNWVSELDVGAL